MKVAHVIPSKTRDIGFPPCEPQYPADFVEVAIVDGCNPEAAFELTNHIAGPWFENPGVTVIGEPNHRSTMVGDVIIMDNGDVLRVDNVDFSKIA